MGEEDWVTIFNISVVEDELLLLPVVELLEVVEVEDEELLVVVFDFPPIGVVSSFNVSWIKSPHRIAK